MLTNLSKNGLGAGSLVSEKGRAIQKLNGEYSLNLLCSTLGSTQSDNYRATEGKETQFEIKHRTLTSIIEEIFGESE